MILSDVMQKRGVSLSTPIFSSAMCYFALHCKRAGNRNVSMCLKGEIRLRKCVCPSKIEINLPRVLSLGRGDGIKLWQQAGKNGDGGNEVFQQNPGMSDLSETAAVHCVPTAKLHVIGGRIIGLSLTLLCSLPHTEREGGGRTNSPFLRCLLWTLNTTGTFWILLQPSTTKHGKFQQPDFEQWFSTANENLQGGTEE